MKLTELKKRFEEIKLEGKRDSTDLVILAEELFTLAEAYREVVGQGFNFWKYEHFSPEEFKRRHPDMSVEDHLLSCSEITKDWEEIDKKAEKIFNSRYPTEEKEKGNDRE